VLERLVFDAEAEARWLDHVEARLVRAATVTDERSDRTSATGGTSRAGQGSAR
jgi:hypothetical protein